MDAGSKSLPARGTDATPAAALTNSPLCSQQKSMQVKASQTKSQKASHKQVKTQSSHGRTSIGRPLCTPALKAMAPLCMPSHRPAAAPATRPAQLFRAGRPLSSGCRAPFLPRIFHARAAGTPGRPTTRRFARLPHPTVCTARPVVHDHRGAARLAGAPRQPGRASPAAPRLRRR